MLARALMPCLSAQNPEVSTTLSSPRGDSRVFDGATSRPWSAEVLTEVIGASFFRGGGRSFDGAEGEPLAQQSIRADEENEDGDRRDHGQRHEPRPVDAESRDLLREQRAQRVAAGREQEVDRVQEFSPRQ